MERHPPLTCKELEPLLDYVDNIDDLELRNRARLLANRCQELERILRAQEMYRGDVSGEELRYDVMNYLNEYENTKSSSPKAKSAMKLVTTGFHKFMSVEKREFV